MLIITLIGIPKLLADMWVTQWWANGERLRGAARRRAGPAVAAALARRHDPAARAQRHHRSDDVARVGVVDPDVRGRHRVVHRGRHRVQHRPRLPDAAAVGVVAARRRRGRRHDDPLGRLDGPLLGDRRTAGGGARRLGPARQRARPGQARPGAAGGRGAGADHRAAGLPRGRGRRGGRRAAPDRARPARRRAGAAGRAGDGDRDGARADGDATPRPPRRCWPARTRTPRPRWSSCATSRAGSTRRSSPIAASTRR